jgi:hypothetical protein
MKKRFLPAALLGLILGFCVETDALAQTCNTRAKVLSRVSVFDNPPTASTSRGFVYGSQIAALRTNSEVLICRDVTVGFGFVSEKWAQIAIWLPAEKRWLYGWVKEDSLTTKITEIYKPRHAGLQLIGAAYAETESSTKATRKPDAAPQPPTLLAAAGKDTAGPSQLIESRLPDNGSFAAPAPSSNQDLPLSGDSILFQLQFVLLLSGAVLLGILAQGAYEMFDTNGRFSWRRFIRPLVVAPLVLLVFLGTVDLSITHWKQALMLCLLAFQAGFSWHKALAKPQ